jgi:hypothetical protein
VNASFFTQSSLTEEGVFGSTNIGMALALGNPAGCGLRQHLYIRFSWVMYNPVRYKLAFRDVLGGIG